MWDNIAWMLGGDVEHSVDSVRAAQYVAIGGREGVVGAGDLRVTQLPGLGAGATVAPGALAVNARHASYEAYSGRHLQAESVAIAPTGASARSDLVIARIEDPYYDGSPYANPDPDGDDPVARQNAQYWRLRVLAGVPVGTQSVDELGLGMSAIALARVDLPVNTASVTQAMITDLRPSTNPAAVEPVGRIMMWPSALMPNGYLLCDGSAFSSADYPTLAALLGDQFYGHSGTTYYLPDLRRRMPLGSGPGYVVGSNEGQADAATRNWVHAHLVPNHGHWVPDHQHIIPEHGHGNSLGLTKDSDGVPSGTGGGQRIKSVTLGGGIYNQGRFATENTGRVATEGQGDQWSGNATVPNLAVAFIIKAA